MEAHIEMIIQQANGLFGHYDKGAIEATAKRIGQTITHGMLKSEEACTCGEVKQEMRSMKALGRR